MVGFELSNLACSPWAPDDLVPALSLSIYKRPSVHTDVSLDRWRLFNVFYTPLFFHSNIICYDVSTEMGQFPLLYRGNTFFSSDEVFEVWKNYGHDRIKASDLESYFSTLDYLCCFLTTTETTYCENVQRCRIYKQWHSVKLLSIFVCIALCNHVHLCFGPDISMSYLVTYLVLPCLDLICFISLCRPAFALILFLWIRVNHSL